jgi:hypothetical protein
MERMLSMRMDGNRLPIPKKALIPGWPLAWKEQAAEASSVFLEGRSTDP